jgi:hypothetical protein
MPDIGDVIRDDSVLIAFRDTSKRNGGANAKSPPSLLADICDDSLQTIEYTHDTPFYADRPGATIIDIQVYTNPKVAKEIVADHSAYKQLAKYQDHHNEYYKTVTTLYRRFLSEYQGYRIGDRFNNLVLRSMGLDTSKGVKSKWRPMDRKEPIEFMQLDITYSYKRQVAHGFKITDRSGAGDN